MPSLSPSPVLSSSLLPYLIAVLNSHSTYSQISCHLVWCPLSLNGSQHFCSTLSKSPLCLCPHLPQVSHVQFFQDFHSIFPANYYCCSLPSVLFVLSKLEGRNFSPCEGRGSPKLSSSLLSSPSARRQKLVPESLGPGAKDLGDIPTLPLPGYVELTSRSPSVSSLLSQLSHVGIHLPKSFQL